MIDFTGKAVLVSGGGSGIGRACLDAFAKAGANIATIEIDASRAAALREEFGEQALVVTGDVTNPATVAALAEAVGAKFSGLDVLVNNVGDFLGVAKPFERHTDAEIEALYAINLRQIFGLTRAMLPLLRARAGEQHYFRLLHRGVSRHSHRCRLCRVQSRHHRFYQKLGGRTGAGGNPGQPDRPRNYGYRASAGERDGRRGTPAFGGALDPAWTLWNGAG